MIIEISAKKILSDGLPERIEIKDVDIFAYDESISQPFYSYVIGKKEPLIPKEISDILLYNKNRKKISELKDYKSQLTIEYPLKIGKDRRVIVFGGDIIFIDIEKHPDYIKEYYSSGAMIYIKNREFLKGDLDILHKYGMDIK